MSPARLMIHAEDVANRAAGGDFARALRCLVGRAMRARRLRTAELPFVQIDSLGGRRCFVAHRARSPVDVPLPGGTYHVTIGRGSLCRRYTLTLEPGAIFHLHLRPLGARL